MSRPSSLRAARARDWPALLREVGNDPGQRRYVDALQKALEGRDPRQLLALLDKRAPVSEVLLPAFAELFRDLKQGRSNGRPRLLTHQDDVAIREAFDRDTASMSEPESRARLGDKYGVSPETIRRSLIRTER